MHACGASDTVAELYDDNNEIIMNEPVYLGGPFVSDDILLRRLHDRLGAPHPGGVLQYATMPTGQACLSSSDTASCRDQAAKIYNMHLSWTEPD